MVDSMTMVANVMASKRWCTSGVPFGDGFTVYYTPDLGYWLTE